MPSSPVRAALTAAVADHRLLDHPYYRKWQAGELTVEDLAAYAAQYRRFEEVLPEVLSNVAGQLPEGPVRRLVADNLEDEKSHPRAHLELFDGFAGAVGADTATASTTATARLVDVYLDGVGEGAVPALAVIAAYESQAAEIASTKADALRDHFDFGPAATEFWDVHAGMEGSHSEWTLEALASLEAEPEVVAEWASKSARAWWSFLDERDQGSF
ncbi:MAG: iron-containing redox enzyme family protein [Acidimicrobiales bacterium]|nr:iron-containing redox enzyme family protein [Acidimicrobiales bacterium]